MVSTASSITCIRRELPQAFPMSRLSRSSSIPAGRRRAAPATPGSDTRPDHRHRHWLSGTRGRAPAVCNFRCRGRPGSRKVGCRARRQGCRWDRHHGHRAPCAPNPHVVEDDVRVRDWLCEQQKSWRVAKDGALPHRLHGCRIAEIGIRRECGCATPHLLQGVDDVHRARHFDDAEEDREEDDGHERELHGSDALLFRRFRRQATPDLVSR